MRLVLLLGVVCALLVGLVGVVVIVVGGVGGFAVVLGDRGVDVDVGVEGVGGFVAVVGDRGVDGGGDGGPGMGAAAALALNADPAQPAPAVYYTSPCVHTRRSATDLVAPGAPALDEVPADPGFPPHFAHVVTHAAAHNFDSDFDSSFVSAAGPGIHCFVLPLLTVRRDGHQWCFVVWLVGVRHAGLVTRCLREEVSRNIDGCHWLVLAGVSAGEL